MSTGEPLRVLIVEDSETDAKLVARELRRTGHTIEFERVEDEAAMRAALARPGWDLIISDWSMPNFSALEALRIAAEIDRDLPFIIVSGTVGEESAVEAMRAGARDYVLKFKLSRLAPVVERELRERDARRRSEAALRASEEQLQHAQKMEVVGQVASGIAHDFNNLLSVIMSTVDLILLDTPADSPQRADLESIRSAGERAAVLTHKLLSMSRAQPLELCAVDVNAVVKGLEPLLRRSLPDDISLDVQLAGAPATVRGDAGQLEQVVMNLILNARDAIRGHGRGRIELRVEIAEMVQLHVSDDGSGMEEATKRRVFEPFFTTKPLGTGTGLGLATSEAIVTRLGGRITVESELERGTTFTVVLPRMDAAPEGFASPAAAKPEGTETILIVEPDDAVRAVAQRVLEHYGYTVLSAPGAAAALERIAHHQGPLDLVLTAVRMPDQSGPELARQIQARGPVAVLYTLGHADEATAAEVAGKTVAKPFTPETLARRVREALD